MSWEHKEARERWGWTLKASTVRLCCPTGIGLTLGFLLLWPEKKNRLASHYRLVTRPGTPGLICALNQGRAGALGTFSMEAGHSEVHRRGAEDSQRCVCSVDCVGHCALGMR